MWVMKPMTRTTALPPNLPPRGLCRAAAAEYIGVSTGKFDQMVEEGLMPKSIALGGRRVWDIRALDRAFDVLAGGDDSNDDSNEWDGM